MEDLGCSAPREVERRLKASDSRYRENARDAHSVVDVDHAEIFLLGRHFPTGERRLRATTEIRTLREIEIARPSCEFS